MKSLLVVEDSEMFYRLVQRAISDVDVLWARTGTEAVDLYREKSPNLVLMDILLPDISGIEVIKMIKKLDQNAKIIVVSGIEQDELTKEILSAGAIEFLSKNAGINYLKKRLQSVFY